MRKYIIHLLKRYIPLYAVMGAMIFSLFLILVTSVSSYYFYTNAAGYYTTTPYAALGFFLSPLLIMSIIAPLFANSYRYSLSSVDVFYQTGKGDKKIRFANNAVVWIGLVAVYVVAFLFAMLALLLKQLPTANQTIYTDYGRYEFILFNFGYYFIALLIMLVFATLNYFVSYYLVTRSNRLINSIATLFIGEGILIVGGMTPIWYVCTIQYYFGADNWIGINALFGCKTSSIISPFMWLAYIFDPLICGNQFTYRFDLPQMIPGFVIGIVMLVIFTAISILCTIIFFKEKESSGEYAGKPFGRDKMQSIVFHTGFGIAALWLGTSQGMTSYIGFGTFSMVSSFVTFAALYYVFTGIMRKNFKFNKQQLILYISIVSIYIVAAIVNMSLNNLVVSNH